MGFVKLDTGLLTSTLWAHREEREVFITALLMAEPRELHQPAPQLEVDSLRETGFVVPPGWYGFVAAAGPGIVRQAIVKPGPGMAALKALGEPDPESRSKEFEGRRLVRVDGGYILLNYIKYRDRDYTTADRSRRYRERLKEPVTASRRDAVTPRRDITQADAEAYAEVQQPPSVSAVAAGAPALPSAKGTWTATQEQLLRWTQAFPGLDVLAELGKIQAYLHEHPKVRFGVARLVPWVEEWLAKEAKGQAGARGQAAPRGGPACGALAPQARPQAAALKAPKLERYASGDAP